MPKTRPNDCVIHENYIPLCYKQTILSKTTTREDQLLTTRTNILRATIALIHRRLSFPTNFKIDNRTNFISRHAKNTATFIIHLISLSDLKCCTPEKNL